MTTLRTAFSATALAAAIVISGLATEPADAITAVGSQPTTPALTVSPTPTVVVSGADEDDRRRLDEALRRFRDQDLDLPDLDVRFYDEVDACQGHYGLFQSSFTPWRVLICTDLDFVPTHELAHAWEAANLDDAARRQYVDIRGLTNWNDADVPWMERGIEDAAFVIHKNLTTTGGNLTSSTWLERVAAYEFLTGRPSPITE